MKEIFWVLRSPRAIADNRGNVSVEDVALTTEFASTLPECIRL
ncbi:MAG: hypothetical protein AAF268_05190 [Cyanobacteria bacterium P01_A01_bin.3]